MDESPHSTSSHTSGMDVSPERDLERDTASMELPCVLRQFFHLTDTLRRVVAAWFVCLRDGED